MNRRNFLRKFGIGAGLAIAAPQIAKALVEERKKTLTEQIIPVLDEQAKYHLKHCHDIYSHPFVRTTKPVKITDDQIDPNRILIQVDKPLHMNDVVYFDPKYTNKDLLLEYVVVRQHVRLGNDYTYSVIPIEPTAKVVKSMRSGIKLFLGQNLNNYYPMTYDESYRVGETKFHGFVFYDKDNQSLFLPPQ